MSEGSKKNTIVVDAMGGDEGPAEVLEGVKLAFEELDQIEKLIVVGDQAILGPLIAASPLINDSRLELHHASQVVDMDDKPIPALKSKKDASMFVGMDLIKEGRASVLMSAGNTGALMAGGTIKFRPLEGIDRPAIGSVWPSLRGRFILIDAGANPASTPENLVHNAILGAHYAKVALGVENPRVGLLTIGTEEGKGTEITNITHQYLKQCKPFLNYQGLIEGFQVFDDIVEVIVCDGFVGNIVLKTCESMFKTLKQCVKEELTQTWLGRAGALLALPAFTRLKIRLSPEQFGGAPLLGLKSMILKAHGSSNRYAFMNAIRIGLQVSQHNMNDDIVADAKQANAIIEQTKKAAAEGNSGS